MKALILTGHFGMGHTSAAQAVEEEIKKKYKDAEIIKVDVVEYVYPEVSRYVYMGFEAMVSKLHNIYNILNRMDEHGFLIPFKNTAAKRFSQLVTETKPDIMISTWPPGSKYISEFRKATGDRTPFIACVTDMIAHSVWISCDADAYIVGDIYTKENMVARGVNPEKIFAAGIPVREIFKKNDIRKSAAGKEILISGGGLGLIPEAEGLLERLERMDNVHVTVITGRNEKLCESLSGRFRNADILGYVDDMEKYMEKADMIISKAGGITLFESIYSEVPLYIIKPFLEQEKDNARYVEEKHIGKVVWGRKGSHGDNLADILENEAELADMKKNIRDVKKSLKGKSIGQVMDMLQIGA